jgi:hypothetical protein
VTAKYTVGHVLVLARDGGSLIDSEPLGIDVDLPSIGPGDGFDMKNNGAGIGVDVGAAWEGGRWALGASVQNVFNTFAWELDGFAYRPGEALFNGADSESDFDGHH